MHPRQAADAEPDSETNAALLRAVRLEAANAAAAAAAGKGAEGGGRGGEDVAGGVRRRAAEAEYALAKAEGDAPRAGYKMHS